MWSLSSFSEQATLHSTIAGKLWYVFVYIFRFVAVMSIGGAVYNDEQSQFKCSTMVLGCQTVCFDQFSKLSHLRFWAFQLLGLNFPVVLFHLFALHERGKFWDVDSSKSSLRSKLGLSYDARNSTNPPRCSSKPRSKAGKSRRGKSYKRKTIYTDYGPREIILTKRIKMAYFLASVSRFLIVFAFLYFAYETFGSVETSYPNKPTQITLSDVLWPEVPRFYACSGDDVNLACEQHLLNGGSSFVPCWVSRPWEKTVFIRYMSIMSVICLLLALFESAYFVIKFCVAWRKERKTRKRRFLRHCKPFVRLQYASVVQEVENFNSTRSSLRNKGRKFYDAP